MMNVERLGPEDAVRYLYLEVKWNWLDFFFMLQDPPLPKDDSLMKFLA